MQGYKHDVVVISGNKVLGGKIVGSGKKMVSIANNSDPFYSCEFETRQEIDEFIKELEEAREEAFSKK